MPGTERGFAYVISCKSLDHAKKEDHAPQRLGDLSKVLELAEDEDGDFSWVP